jgi:hypothetical protein
MKGKEGMEKESEEWANALQNIVEAHLKAAQVEVVSSAISPDQLEGNPDAPATCASSPKELRGCRHTA